MKISIPDYALYACLAATTYSKFYLDINVITLAIE